VLRSEGKGTFEVKSYDVYGPKIVATRQNFDDHALESRFLIEEMGKSKLRPDIRMRLSESFDEDAKQLRNKLLMWRLRNYHIPLNFDDTPIEGLHPRLLQIIVPLLAVMPGESIHETLVAHARRYSEELVADRALSWESEVVLAILRLHHETELDNLTIKEIAAKVNEELEINETLTSKKVGWVMRAKLQLKANRTNRGFTLSVSRNAERLEYWRERLGITNADITGEEVNDVNVVNDAAVPEKIEYGFNAEDIPF
jgi:hypothetical protein